MLNVTICRCRRFFVFVSLVILLVLVCIASIPSQISAASPIKFSQNEPLKKKVAIVIDDFGNNMPGTTEMMALQLQFTAAVMPFLPTTHRDAEWAHSLGHNVIVHLPMEPIRGLSSWLGPGAVTTALSDEEIRKRVNAAIDDVPFTVGMNNHMGSKATADPRVMKVVLEVCHERGLFFLDSRTNYRSVVTKLAKQQDVRTLDNHIFLDDQYTTRHINKQIALIVDFLLKHDECVVIGHVGPSGLKTAAALAHATPKLADKLEFVSLLEMLAAKDEKRITERIPRQY